jgi:hypothetical protein
MIKVVIARRVVFVHPTIAKHPERKQSAVTGDCHGRKFTALAMTSLRAS